MSQPDEREPTEPQLLSYASAKTPRPQIFSLIIAGVAGLFLLALAFVAGIIGVLLLLPWNQRETDLQFVFGCAVLVFSLFLAICGVIQLLATITAMWFPTRDFWWDKGFVTIRPAQNRSRSVKR